MDKRHIKRKIRVVEILVIAVSIAMLSVLLYPIVFRAQIRRDACQNQVREITGAIQMYTQDNKGRYPAHPWTSGILPYLHGPSTFFHCPSDPTDQQSMCSYAYNGALMRLDRTGINEAQLSSPVDVGVICDAAPSFPLGTAGYIPGAGLLPDSEHNAVPLARHNHGVVVGFVDGHVKWAPGDFDPADYGSPVTKGFYADIALSLINNPGGALPASAALPNAAFKFPTPSPTHPMNRFEVGGEYCTAPLVTALAELWKEKGRAGNPVPDYCHKPGFLGEYYTCRGSLLSSSFLWGSAQVGADLKHGPVANSAGNSYRHYFLPMVAISYECVTGNPGSEAGTPIAHDAVVCIVAKNTRIAPNPIGSLTTVKNYSSPVNGWYVCNTATIAAWFTTDSGYSANQWQAYIYSTMTSTAYTFYHYLKIPMPTVSCDLTAQAILCSNDNDMVDKVACDPLGIGYCSSAFVDLDRVQVLGMVDATCAGGQCYWPNADANHRTCLPNPYPHGGPNAGLTSGHYRWPAALMRTLFVYTRGDGSLLSLYADRLKRGPLFACSYW